MNCLDCNIPLRHRLKLNMDAGSIIYEYYFCDKCEKSFDASNYEIIHKGSTYIRKKDDPQRHYW